MQENYQFDSVRLELTGKCDMSCLYCHAGGKNNLTYLKGELSHERWLEIIIECKDLGVKNFTITGGEPFLYKKWIEIIEACGCDSRVVISTNGKHFSEENLEIIYGLPQVKEFRTSLDGLKTNDIIREGSFYLDAIKDIEFLRKKLPDKNVMIQTVIYRNNINEIMPLYEKLKELEIYCWRLSQLWKTVRTEKNSGVVDFSDYDKMFDVYTEVIRHHQSDNKPFLLRIDNVYYSWIDKEDYAAMDINSHPCEYNSRHLCVNANGDLMYCPSINLAYGSVKDQPIAKAIKSSEWISNFNKITVESLGCGDCRYLKICGGGCRADALKWLENIKKVDPNSCCMMPRIEERILPLLGEGERKAFEFLINKEGAPPIFSGDSIEEIVKS